MQFHDSETSFTINNCLDVVISSASYHSVSSLQQSYQFISENFDQIANGNKFKELSKYQLNSLLENLNRENVHEISMYTAIVNWVKCDQSREADFSSLFLKLELQNFSPDFVIDAIAQEPLVKNCKKCLNAVLFYFCARTKKAQQQEGKSLKILCVSGAAKKTIVEVDDVFGKSKNDLPYPNLPYNVTGHCLLKLDNFIYCLGGVVATGRQAFKSNVINTVYRLNLKGVDSQWEEVASMKERRCYFGAATWNGTLVVAGGFNEASRTHSSLRTTELYQPDSNKWRTLASMNEEREKHALVAADNKLFAIGGWQGGRNDSISSVEQLDNVDEQWKITKSMNVKRHCLATASCNNAIYAIGGVSTRTSLKTVEKYDPNNDEWSFVRSMKEERKAHGACVLEEKIFVFGGRSARLRVDKTIECYDSSTNEWKVIGETEQEFCYHAIITV